MEQGSKENVVFGRNVVSELLISSTPVECIYISKLDTSPRLKKLYAQARAKGIPVKSVTGEALDRICAGAKHQGAAAIISCAAYSEIEAVYEKAGDEPLFVVICDGVEDPHNLGAIIRTAEGAGAHGVFIPKRSGVGLTKTVVSASAGAVFHIPIVRVPNISALIRELKEKNVWIYCADMDGESLFSTSFGRSAVGLVIGAEGAGVSRLARAESDLVVSLPMNGTVSSLNVSVATGIILYEIAKQRAV